MHAPDFRRPIPHTLLAVAALVLVAACDTMMPKSEPKSMEPIVETITLMATVEKIDAAKRLVSLKSDAGETVTVEVDPAVQNLSKVLVGDKVVVRYKEALGATIADSATAEPVSIDLEAERAKPGERPRAAASSTTNIKVTIASVDAKHDMVNFYGEDGLVRALKVETPQGKAFIKKLKAGDTVVVSYTEALAISVEPAM